MCDRAGDDDRDREREPMPGNNRQDRGRGVFGTDPLGLFDLVLLRSRTSLQNFLYIFGG
jgi:hypothetical protein